MKKTNKAKRIRFIHNTCTLSRSTTATETCYDCIDHIDSGQYLAECTGAKSHEGISGSVFSSRHQPSSPHWLQLPSHVNNPKFILVLDSLLAVCLCSDDLFRVMRQSVNLAFCRSFSFRRQHGLSRRYYISWWFWKWSCLTSSE